MTISQALTQATQKLQQNKIPTPHLDAEILLSHILKKPREYILARTEKKLTKTQITNYKLQITKRAKGKPIAYITKHKQFYGLDFYVNKNILIPRPETELMIDEALKEAKPLIRGFASLCIIDIGTGSGCIIITLAKLLAKKKKELGFGYPKPSSFFFLATDISKPALTIARKNAKLHHIDKKIKFIHGNLLEPILNNSKHLNNLNNPIIITANLPYLTPAQVKNSPTIQQEPKFALSAGADGLKYYRQLFKQIKKLNALCAMRYALCEIDPRQTIMLKKLIKKILPNAKIQIKKDLAGHNRLVSINLQSSI